MVQTPFIIVIKAQEALLSFTMHSQVDAAYKARVNKTELKKTKTMATQTKTQWFNELNANTLPYDVGGRASVKFVVTLSPLNY